MPNPPAFNVVFEEIVRTAAARSTVCTISAEDSLTWIVHSPIQTRIWRFDSLEELQRSVALVENPTQREFFGRSLQSEEGRDYLLELLRSEAYRLYSRFQSTGRPLDGIVQDIIQYAASLSEATIEALPISGDWVGWKVASSAEGESWNYTLETLQYRIHLIPNDNFRQVYLREALNQEGRERMAVAMQTVANTRRAYRQNAAYEPPSEDISAWFDRLRELDATTKALLQEMPATPKPKQESVWQHLLKDD